MMNLNYLLKTADSADVISFMPPAAGRLLGLVLVIGLLGPGCGMLRNLKSIRIGKKQAAEQPAAVSSRLDSLWQEKLPADTILLKARKKEEPALYPAIREDRRRPGYVDLMAGGPLPGYRVQLASAERKEELEPLLLKIRQEMKTEAYLELHGARYTVRIGDFRNKAEAEAEKKRAVLFGYRQAWVVQTKVNPR